MRLDPEELPAALRRALFVLASGGDPHRDVDPNGRAVTTLANELDAPERRAELASALSALREAGAGLHRVTEAVDLLLGDADGAWRWLAAALLADELSSD